MLAVSVALYSLVGIALISMGYRYITTIPPIDYHADILSGVSVTDETVLILGALYKVMGGAFAALGAGMLVIAVFGVRADLLWAKLALLLMSGVVGYFATMVPRLVEAETDVRTPWRIAAGLTAVSALAFVLAFF
ncbi:hypothetical protein ACOXXX_05660 [Thalassococcus sp. BH17M4-6]|uniref:hypothetical protein n=1 Tax=Thalassococcus sp. BH17M4-6 TaxID=3413148 RepID=UPI003BD5889A